MTKLDHEKNNQIMMAILRNSKKTENYDVPKELTKKKIVPVEIQIEAHVVIERLSKYGTIQIARNFLDTVGIHKVEVSNFLEKYGQVTFDKNGVAQFDRSKKSHNYAAMLDARWDKLR